ncbi:hypothetical protein METBIDRAFT_55357 [Metschnikowia bicuspidata var. bicuspidata NRRL YB-4993]|uniref:Uncharacterized protein n=1 Tax=Metschnikowia bicuspidata var. bicuspidata NRRL YB-4993 TaxID=869754 RepID=A0A1A0HAZ8_9ASCO|nr:hypothetical protein METBIDRAFT_55357 [Metschnikowia bicuspidata var. bicuspidata NRRL YB-4993]OBA21057.1 hypothetical protein METBIDRAFT_55357 [Metschnikowia bicuspidata var. bicuspidata NRRL YB-4993]
MSFYAQLPNGASPARATPRAPKTPLVSAEPLAPNTPQGAATPQAPRTPRPSRFFGSPGPSPLKTGTPEHALQKQCADLYAQLSAKTAQCQHAEDELARHHLLVDELAQKAQALDRRVRALEDERRKATDLHKQELALYQDMVDDLQRQAARATQRLDQDRRVHEAWVREHEDKHAVLAKRCRALQSNFELERNLKAVLIEQIEFLTKERDIYFQTMLATSHGDSARGPSETTHTHSGLHLDSDSDGSVHGTHLLGSLAELARPEVFDSSSPIKDHAHDYLESSLGFHFPASNPAQAAPLLPQTASASRRYSLPASERKALHPMPNASFDDDFVLSPLKLTPHPNSSYFEADSSGPASHTRPSSVTNKRYSGSRANHSRYNSHDIVPIKVEFEMLDQLIRSASAPDKHHLQHLSSVAETNPIQDSDMAFMRLNGYTGPLKRDSLMTDSSKRSSFMSDINILSGDITKQEITKLKFELQSLKLHNEKLLSYIGFELQKQKKNIKKLSSKQNLRPKPSAQKIEYSDAKLIEKLREMLINKKRVLRSVSINPILSTKYCAPKNSLLQPLVGLGVFCNQPEDEDDFFFKSHFISSLKKDDCDDYGFLKHNCKYNLRVLLKKNQEYSEYNDEQTVKKHKSQTFRSTRNHEREFDNLGADIDDIDDIDDADVYNSNLELTDDWESEGSLVSDIDYDKLNRFNQMKYLILGKEHMKMAKRSESIADENLKYKFLTIAIGIVIVGIKFTTHPHQQLTAN